MEAAVSDEKFRDAMFPRWLFDPTNGADAPAAAELERARAFVPERLAPLAVPPTDEERKALEEKLRAALLADFSGTDWLGVRERRPDGTGEVGDHFSLVPTAAACERVWPPVFREWLVAYAPAMATRDELRAAAEKGSAKAKAPHAFDVLKSAVAFRWKPLVEAIGTSPDETTGAKVADWLKHHGLPGGATYVRRAAPTAERWADLLFVARVLAQATWKEETEALMSGASHPAVSTPVVSILATARKAQGSLLDDEWELLADKPQGRGKTARTIGKVAGVDPKLLSLLDDSTLLDLALFMVNQVHRQRITREMYGHPGRMTDNVDKLVVVGGWPALTAALEMPASMRGKVANTADLFAGLRLDVPGLPEAKLFQWSPLRATTDRNGLTRPMTHRGGGHSRLELTLLGPLGSYYVHQLDPMKHNRSLSPVPLWQQPPPLPGRKNDRAGLKMLMLLLLKHFRENAAALATVGGVEIDRATWSDLLDEAKLRASILPAVLKGWKEGFGGRPPVLTETTGGLYDLAPAHKPERDFIIESFTAGKAKAREAALKAKRGGGRKR